MVGEVREPVDTTYSVAQSQRLLLRPLPSCSGTRLLALLPLRFRSLPWEHGQETTLRFRLLDLA